MNRRSFLRFLGLAPIAAPIAAAWPKYATGGYVSGATFASPLIGEATLGEAIKPIAKTMTIRINADTSALETQLARVREIMARAPIFGAPEIAAQMREHDLFSDFPTAAADAPRQPAHTTIVDHPSSAERLRRSWGSNRGERLD